MNVNKINTPKIIKNKFLEEKSVQLFPKQSNTKTELLYI